MVGGGPFALPPGAWTDDTSMALCLASSLVEQRGFDAHDQMDRYLAWWQTGAWSSTGHCFDIGMTVAKALREYQKTGEPFSGQTDYYSAGNGALMRLAPVPMAFWHDREQAIVYSGESTRTTHATPVCIEASRWFGAMLHAVLSGASREAILDAQAPDDLVTEPIRQLVQGTWRDKAATEIRGTGYVVESLEAALWCFAQTDNFRDAILMATNLGDDADTTAAICGQLAGAFYGEEGIPAVWRTQLVMVERIQDLADQLWAMGTSAP